MSDGFIRWYRESATTPILTKQVELFSGYGIHLHHPALETVMVLDIEGNHIPVEQDWLDRFLGLRVSSINVNWWFSANVNMVDEYTYEPFGCEIQTIWLDGLTPEEMETVETALTEGTSTLPTSTRALIVDRRGISDPEDWDALVLHEGERVPVFPDRVVAQGPIASTILRSSPNVAAEGIGHGLTRLTPQN